MLKYLVVFIAILLGGIKYFGNYAGKPAIKFKCIFLNMNCPPQSININGYTKKEFNELKDLLKEQLQDGLSVGAQVSVFVEDEEVVNIAGGYTDLDFKAEFTTSSVVNVFSSGKVVAAVIIAHLFEKYNISYTDKITKYWPEFDKFNKSDITITDLLKHEAGLQWFSRSVKLNEFPNKALDSEIEIKKKSKWLANFLASQPHISGAKKANRSYHGFLRGIYLDELSRRIDKQGRSLAQVLQDVFVKELKLQNQIFVGMDKNDLKNVEENLVKILPFDFTKLLVPAVLGDYGFAEPLSADTKRLFKVIQDENADLYKATKFAIDIGDCMFEDRDVSILNTNAWRGIELISANSHATAHALAKIFNVILSQKSSLISKQFANKALKRDKESYKFDYSVQTETDLTIGGFGHFTQSYFTDINRDMGGTEGREEMLKLSKDIKFYGWAGAGGSLLIGSQKSERLPAFTFSYVMNSMRCFDLIDARSAALFTKAVAIIEKHYALK